LATIIQRELRQAAAVAGNHFLLVALLLFALSPRNLALLMVAGLIVLFPLSADPLRKIPAERLELWPLSRTEQVRIRIISVFLSPVVWVTIAAPLWGGKRYAGISMALILVAFASNGIFALWAQKPRQFKEFSLLHRLPSFPGPLGGLVKKNLREMFLVLDPYAGLAVAVGATIYRFTAPKPVPDAVNGGTLLVTLTMSTLAQRLFALDSGKGFERYSLMPIRGWQILLAKDLAFLVLLLVLVLPLAPLSGMSAGFVLLACGHRPSVLDPQRQPRWRFVAGARGWLGLVQVLAMFAAGLVTFRVSSLALVPCAMAYLVSLYHYGNRLEKRWSFFVLAPNNESWLRQ
jgi:hypothetical protein